MKRKEKEEEMLLAPLNMPLTVSTTGKCKRSLKTARNFVRKSHRMALPA